MAGTYQSALFIYLPPLFVFSCSAPGTSNRNYLLVRPPPNPSYIYIYIKLQHRISTIKLLQFRINSFRPCFRIHPRSQRMAAALAFPISSLCILHVFPTKVFERSIERKGANIRSLQTETANASNP